MYYVLLLLRPTLYIQHPNYGTSTVHPPPSATCIAQLLHLVLRRLAGPAATPPCPGLLQFLLVDELLVDIGDDLTDYEVRAVGVCLYEVCVCVCVCVCEVHVKCTFVAAAMSFF